MSFTLSLSRLPGKVITVTIIPEPLPSPTEDVFSIHVPLVAMLCDQRAFSLAGRSTSCLPSIDHRQLERWIIHPHYQAVIPFSLVLPHSIPHQVGARGNAPFMPFVMVPYRPRDSYLPEIRYVFLFHLHLHFPYMMNHDHTFVLPSNTP